MKSAGPPPQHPTTAASAALLSVAGMLAGRRFVRRAHLRCRRHDYETVLGFAFDWTGDKLAVCLVWLAQQPVFEACLCSSPWSTLSGRLQLFRDTPPDTPPRRFQVRVGLQDYADVPRLPVPAVAGKQVDDQVLPGDPVIR